MKVLRVFGTTLAITLLTVAMAHAQQADSGTANAGTYGQYGTPGTPNSGFNAGNGTVSYETPATSNAHVAGTAEIAIAGESTGKTGPTSATTKSSTLTSFDGTAVGPQSTLTFNAGAEQGNGASAPASTPGNFADGGNRTSAGIQGTYTGNGTMCDPISGDGAATAFGKTFASSTTSPDGLSAESIVKTIGFSGAVGTMTGPNGTPVFQATVAGNGGAEAASLVKGPNGSGAEANGFNSMQYGASNPTSGATGLLQGQIVTNVNINPGGNVVSAAATTTSSAQAH